MELSDLTYYAKEKYNIEEEHKWPEYPNFSVLSHPQTGKMIALLMRYWNSDLGEFNEICDLKCGSIQIRVSVYPYIRSSFRVKGDKWRGIIFNRRTDPEVVLELFDSAVRLETEYGCTLVLAADDLKRWTHRDTPLPFSNGAPSETRTRSSIPEKIRQMMRLYEYRSKSDFHRARNFYRQGKFMEDYEDDVPWNEEFVCYFPTYHDMTVNQLRGYFTWRKKIRQGIFEPISTSAAYVYIYELLNGIGARTFTERVEKLRAFEKGYVDAGFGDRRMRKFIHEWLFDLCVIGNLDRETTGLYIDSDITEYDNALGVLMNPSGASDADVFAALFRFGGKNTLESDSVTSDPSRAARVFSNSWRNIQRDCKRSKRSFFEICFGARKSKLWHPLAKAVYFDEDLGGDREYVLNDYRKYTYHNLSWRENCFYRNNFCIFMLDQFLRETDLVMRAQMKTGRKLKENPDYTWMHPFILEAVREEILFEREASRPKIEIDISGLEKIRRDAEKTRDSLLTDEERFEEMPSKILQEESEEVLQDTALQEKLQETESPLSEEQRSILAALLREEDPAEIIKACGLMPSIAADLINEALYEIIGDIAVTCENDRLALVEDYIEDIAGIIGG